VSAPDSALPETTPATTSGRDEILRFRLSERQMHWAVAVPFMICYATAVVLLTVYNAHPQRPLRTPISWIHRASGLALFFLPLWSVIQHWHDLSVHRINIGEVWRWTLADVKWLFLMGPSTINKNIALPEQGKFNAAEKINFMVLTATVPVYICTGLLIWFHQFVFVAWVIHLSLAATATVLMGGHIFMATVNPDTRVGLSGMVTGLVDRHWASHHYGRWYKEQFVEPVAAVLSDVSSAALEPVDVLTSAAPATLEPVVAALPEVEPAALEPAQVLVSVAADDQARPAGWRPLWTSALQNLPRFDRAQARLNPDSMAAIELARELDQLGRRFELDPVYALPRDLRSNSAPSLIDDLDDVEEPIMMSVQAADSAGC
jgi:formate dehydrogenase subunit gamma